MNKLAEWIEQNMLPTISKLTNQRYFSALKSGFMVIMPLTIIGSVFTLIPDFPLSEYNEFMMNIFGKNWTSYIEVAYRATFNILGLVFTGTYAYELSKKYDEKLNSLNCLVMAIVAYILVTPKSITTEAGEVVNKVLSFTWLGTQGIITAMLISILTVETIRYCVKHNLVIKMPDSVPPMVANSFSALIPGICVILVMMIINGVCVNLSGSFHELVYNVIQLPLQGLSSGLISICLVSGLSGSFWWFGIHPSVITTITNPLLTANADANAALAASGQLSLSSGNIGTIQVYDQFATLGGSGMTLGLIIAIVLVARSNRMKGIKNLSLIPALFNINEPLVFGLPIVFNPLMLIPITIAPIISVLIVYVAVVIKFMPMFTNVMVPWATPVIISGFLVSGWQGAVIQIITVAVSTCIYYPFVKALDTQFLKEEEKQ